MEDVQFTNQVSKRLSLFRAGNAKLSHFRSDAQRTNIPKSFEMLIYNHYIIFERDVKSFLSGLAFFLVQSYLFFLNVYTKQLK